MPLIPLTRGLFAQVDDEDMERLSRWKWQAVWKKNRNRWIVVRSTKGKGAKRAVKMASEVMGEAPAGLMYDHKNGDNLDNRKSNLRLATNQQNQHNQRHLRIDNTSGYKGVTWFKPRGTWVAQIYHHKKHIVLGYFRDKQQAALAYNEAAIRLFGEFAAPNEIRKG